MRRRVILVKGSWAGRAWCSILACMLVLCSSCYDVELQDGNPSRLPQIAEQVKRKIAASKGITAAHEEIQELLHSGPYGMLWLFSVAVSLPHEIACGLMYEWNTWAVSVCSLGLDESYRAMFPYDPYGVNIPEDVLLDDQYLLALGWPSLGCSLILNPVKGYERLHGRGSWPVEIDLRRFVVRQHERGEKVAKEKREWLLKCARMAGMELDRVENLRVAMSSEANDNDVDACWLGNGVMYNNSGRIVGVLTCDSRLLETSIAMGEGNVFPPRHLALLLNEGVSALPAVFRIWAEERNCQFLATWDYWLRKSVNLGFWPAFGPALSVCAADALSEGSMVRVVTCKGGWFDSWSSTFNLDGTPSRGTSNSPSVLETVSDGNLCILNPIPVYEGARGSGSWPSDLPIERIQDPGSWTAIGVGGTEQ